MSKSCIVTLIGQIALGLHFADSCERDGRSLAGDTHRGEERRATYNLNFQFVSYQEVVKRNRVVIARLKLKSRRVEIELRLFIHVKLESRKLEQR